MLLGVLSRFIVITAAMGVLTAVPGHALCEVLRVTSPAPDARVKGPITFVVDAKNLPAGAGVEWLLNGVPLDGPICVPPYSYAWHSALVWDGPASVQAVALDANGKTSAASDPVPFYVDNTGGVVKLVSPDPAALAKGEKLSGTIEWTVTCDRSMTPEEEKESKEKTGGRKPIEATMFFIDGRDWKIQWGRSTATQTLDTTTLPNGRHVLMNTAWPWPKVNPCVGWVQFEVIIDNGRVPMAIRPRWADMILKPGEKLAIEPRVAFTDGSAEPLQEAATYTSGDPAVAAVDAAGTVTAVAPGVTTVTVEAMGRKASVRVVVNELDGLPHFSRSGKILTKYDLRQSLWVRSLFGFGPHEITQNRELVQQGRAAAINTLTSGFYINPADGSNPPDFEAFCKGYEPWWNRIEAPAREHDFCLLLTGDDICRTSNEMNNSVNNAWSAQAIQYAFMKLRDSGRAVCVEMVDEISFLWGGTPTPTDGRWQKKNPPMADDGFVKLMGAINAVKDRPPITWPIGGISSDEAAKNWMGNPAFSDYATIYWDTFAWRRAYQWGMSLPQMKDALDRAVLGRYRVIQRDKPMLLLASICGPWLGNDGAGSQFIDDDLHLRRFLDQGNSAVTESAQVMYAAARGMAGVRAYNFDNESWKRERSKGQGQTGSEPFETGTNRWAGLSAAFNLVQRLEPHLLQRQASALDLGPDIVTGARDGGMSRVLLAVNFSESQQQANVGLDAYRYPPAEGTPVMRYRVAGANARVERAPGRGQDAVTFAPGEAIVWLFGKQPLDGPADTVPPAIAITSPLPDSTVTGEVELTAVAEDEAGIGNVEFFIDGSPAGKAERAPYTMRCNTAGLKAGVWHRICAVASDTTGNASEARIMLRAAEAGP